MDQTTRQLIDAIFEDAPDGLFEDELTRALTSHGQSSADAAATIAQAIEDGLIKRIQQLRDTPVVPMGMEGCRTSEPYSTVVLVHSRWYAR